MEPAARLTVGVACLLLAGLAGSRGGGSEHSPDDRFISKLDDVGRLPAGTTAKDRDELIKLGHTWCRFLGTPGVTRADVQHRRRCRIAVPESADGRPPDES